MRYVTSAITFDRSRNKKFLKSKHYHLLNMNGPVMILFKAGTVQYLTAVDRETPTSEHRLS